MPAEKISKQKVMIFVAFCFFVVELPILETILVLLQRGCKCSGVTYIPQKVWFPQRLENKIMVMVKSWSMNNWEEDSLDLTNSAPGICAFFAVTEKFNISLY